MPNAPIPIHPLAPPTVSGQTVTINLLLQQPSLVTRALVLYLISLPDLTTTFFGGASGGVTGGAIVYEKVPTKPQSDLTRQAEEIAPAAEYPIIGAEVGEELLAPVTKYGGKFYITDEARDRNQTWLYQRLTAQLAFKVADSVNRAGLAIVDAALVAAAMTATTSDWGAYNPNVAAGTEPPPSPADNLAEIQMAAKPGVTYDTLVLNEIDALAYSTAMGKAGMLLYSAPPAAPTAVNPTVINMGSTIPAGTGYLVDSGDLGGMRMEQPLRTITYRADDTDRTWVQTGVRPLMFVDNPAAGVKLTIPGSGAVKGDVVLGGGFSRPSGVNPP